MKATIMAPTEVEFAAVRLTLPIRHRETLDELAGAPGLAGSTLRLTIDIDAWRVRNWPLGQGRQDYHIKVVDEGRYELLDADGDILAVIANDYVPDCLPQEYGDYIKLSVNSDGTIANRRAEPNKFGECFWPSDV